MPRTWRKQRRGRGRGSRDEKLVGTDGVELGVGGELEDVADDGAVGGVEAGAAGAPKGLQDVLYRVLGARAGQQREVLVPPERRRR